MRGLNFVPTIVEAEDATSVLPWIMFILDVSGVTSQSLVYRRLLGSSVWQEWNCFSLLLTV